LSRAWSVHASPGETRELQGPPRLLAAFDVGTLAHRYPARLSGGEQQRVALARGFATETPVVLLDEVTSNIDEERRTIVARAIRDLAEARRAVLLVTHDLPTARLSADRIFLLTPNGLR
jgi:ABC-type polar amino acid transport system ATPase subunit